MTINLIPLIVFTIISIWWLNSIHAILKIECVRALYCSFFYKFCPNFEWKISVISKTVDFIIFLQDLFTETGICAWWDSERLQESEIHFTYGVCINCTVNVHVEVTLNRWKFNFIKIINTGFAWRYAISIRQNEFISHPMCSSQLTTTF